MNARNIITGLVLLVICGIICGLSHVTEKEEREKVRKIVSEQSQK